MRVKQSLPLRVIGHNVYIFFLASRGKKRKSEMVTQTGHFTQVDSLKESKAITSSGPFLPSL